MKNVEEIWELIKNAELKITAMTGKKVRLSLLFDDDVKFEPIKKSKEDALLDLCVEEFGIDSITRKSKKAYYVQARFAFSALAHHYLGMNYSDIARIVDLDHSTVIHGVSRSDHWKKTYQPFAIKFYKIENRLIDLLKFGRFNESITTL